MDLRKELEHNEYENLIYLLGSRYKAQNLVEMFLKKTIPALYKSLGVYLPLITTNCAVLGVALTNVQNDYGILSSTVAGIATAVGFTVSIVIMAGLREKIEYNDIPEPFKGMPVVLLTAGLMSIAFFGFSGLI